MIFSQGFTKRFAQLCGLAVALSGLALAQTDRGIITGTVQDPAHAVVANATITVTNNATGGVYDTKTTSAGDYSVIQLPPGFYTVTVEAPGFEKYIGTGTQVNVNTTSRVDVTLTVGTVTQSVTVDATAPLLKSETDEQSHNVNTQQILQLPLEGTGGARNPRSFVIMVPGVSGAAEGTSGHVEGQPSNTHRLYIDGQDISSSISNGTNTGPPPQEMVQEFALQTSNMAAEYGSAEGGMYVFATKSGTNQLHGSLFEYWQNNLLDADHPYTNTNPFDRKNDFGFSVSGPVIIPKIYNGKNKTFFIVVFEDAKNGLSASGATNTVPTPAYRTGNFSAALGAKLNGTDPLGNPYYANEIYDPTTTTMSASGVAYRIPFPNNTIPTSRLDPVALKIQNFIPVPDVPGATLLNNWYQSPKYGTYSVQPAFKIDHYISDKQKISAYVDRPFNVAPNNEDALPFPITQVEIPHGSTWIPRLNYDYTIAPTLLLHMGLGYLRFHSPSGTLPGEQTYNAASQLGFVGSATGLGMPTISIGTSSTGGGMGPNMGPASLEDTFYNKLSSVAGLTWIHGSHSYKFGGEWANNAYDDVNLSGTPGNLSFSAAETGDPSTVGQSLGGAGSPGMSYASFLLGLVDSASVKAPQELEYRNNRGAWYIQDSWKVTHKLTIDYGLRWDIQAQGHEIHDRSSMFGPTIVNPTAGGLLGGTVYEGYGAGRCNCYFDHPYPWAFGPRFGFAYNVTPKTVIRGGWGVVYTSIPYGSLTGSAVGGVGINTISFTSLSPTLETPAATLSQGLVYSQAALTQANFLNPGFYPNSAGNPNPAAVNAPPFFVDPNADRPGRVHQFSFNLQHQLLKNLLVEAAYVGNRGVWENTNGLVALNDISAADLAAHGLSLSNPANLTLLTSAVGSAAAIAAGIKLPYAGYSTTQTVAQSLRPYPQFSSAINPTFAPLGNNWYDSLQAKVTQRYSYGLTAQAAYTFSKEEATGQAINDVFNRPNQKSLASYSQPNLFTLSFIYEVPLQKLPGGQQWLVKHIVSGWQFSSLLRYSSGALIAVPGSQGNLNSLIFQSTRMNRVPGQPLFLVNPNCGCYNPYNQLILNPKAWADVPNGQWGYSAPYYNDYRAGRTPSEQAGLGRTFRPTEKVRLQVRIEFYNVFNRIIYGGGGITSSNPLATPTTNSLGQYTGGFGFQNPTGIGGERTGQAVFRVDF